MSYGNRRALAKTSQEVNPDGGVRVGVKKDWKAFKKVGTSCAKLIKNTCCRDWRPEVEPMEKTI